MPVYCYECSQCGPFEAEQSIHDPALTICPQGHAAKRVLAPVQFCVPEQHKAVTYAGREGDKRVARHHRVNKEVAEGLAKGTMRPPDDRDVAGDKQPREFVAQLNSMYDSAKNS